MKQLVRVQVVPTLDTGAYAAGDQISTLQTVDLLRGGFGGTLTLVTVNDKALQSLPLDLYFFDRSVTVAADQAAASFSDADRDFCLGVVSILAADYDADAAGSIATVAVDFPLLGKDGSKNVYMAIVSRGAPTYAATSLTISLTVEVDA